jgi:Na+/proline symporter
MANNSKIKRWLWLQKEGIIIGTLVGLVFWYLDWNSFLPIQNKYLSAIATVAIMAIVGAIIDAIYEPNK